MRRRSGAYRRKLSSARLEFASDRRLRKWLQGPAVVALIGIAAVAGFRLYADGRAPATRLYELQQENAALRAELAGVRTELAMERSTRTALAGQVTELNERAGALRSQLDFINAQGGRPGKSR